MAERAEGHEGRREETGAQPVGWARSWALGPMPVSVVPSYFSHVASGSGREEAGSVSDIKDSYESAGHRPADT